VNCSAVLPYRKDVSATSAGTARTRAHSARRALGNQRVRRALGNAAGTARTRQRQRVRRALGNVSGYGAHSATSAGTTRTLGNVSGNGAHSATSAGTARNRQRQRVRRALGNQSGTTPHTRQRQRVRRALGNVSGYGAHALSAQGAAESAKAIAVGRWVRLGPDTLEAVILPAEGFRTVTIAADVIDSAEGEPWPVGVWITMNDNGVVVTRPEVLLPNDGRNYQLVWTGKSYVAGCRSFTYQQAVHWGDPDHASPVSARMLLAEVERQQAR
jgi:hypothetical protein